MNENITVNDGKGLYDNIGLVDTIASDLNNIPRLMIDGQFFKVSALFASVGQRLGNLKKGIKEELDSKDEIIEELKRINNALVEEKTGLPVKE